MATPSATSRRYDVRVASVVAIAKYAEPGGGGVVKHAGSAALDEMEPLLAELRELPELQERQRGVFYRKSRAFLHFHEDAAGMFADVRLADDFERLPVNTRAEQQDLVRRIRSGA
jgi:hypothetical protein